MTTLADVAEGLADRLATINGLRTYDVVPSAPQFPCAIVDPPTVDYETLDDLGQVVVFPVVVLVSSTTDRQQRKLLEYQERRGARSVKAAFEADRTLGLTGVDALNTGNRGLGIEEQAGYRGFGAVFEVTVRIT